MFLVDIKPYRKEVQAFKDGHGIPSDRNRLKAIIDVFDKHLKFVEYPGSLPTKLSCGGCITNAFNRLIGKIAREGHKPVKLTPNIPALKPKKDKKEVVVTEIKEEGLSKEAQIAHLQQQCKEKGLKFHHKAGIKKLQALLEA